jgi:hypothetical protein
VGKAALIAAIERHRARHPHARHDGTTAGTPPKKAKSPDACEANIAPDIADIR